MARSDSVPLWELKRVSKAFPGVQALDDVSVSIHPGEILALVGENGSGKSTLAKCLAGVHQPEQGEILHQGEVIELHHPFEARAKGVATIYQEFSLVPTLSVAENIFLGRYDSESFNFGIDWDQINRKASEILEMLSIEIDPRLVVRDLSVAKQQLIEITKAMSMDSTLLIMDEPTAALGLSETEQLHQLIKRLADQGQAILYISHRLDEVFQVADRIMVLKDGNLVDTQPISALTMNDVVRMMVGFDISQHYPKEVNTTPAVCLQARGLSTDAGVTEATFDVHVGEVFGLGGMVGAGRSEIARALFGLDPITSGKLYLHGKEIQISHPADSIQLGIGLVPENRKADGLFFNFKGPPNITLSRLDLIIKQGFLDLTQEREFGEEYFDRLNITKSGLKRSVQFLSGGNQQKVVIARWLYSNAKLLIFDEPTQGVDIGAKIEVYKVINELTANGYSVLLISSDYPELLAMSDRIAIVRDGKILQINQAQELTEYELLSIASGANGNGP